MREQLNNNPLAQLAVVAVLLLATGFFLLTKMGGGEEAEEAPSGAVATTVTGAEGAALPVEGELAPATGAAAVPPPSVQPPRAVVHAYESGATVALLFTRDGGIDDELVHRATDGFSAFPNVASFVVPVRQIARYASLTGGVGVERVPALVVLSPRSVSGGVPEASVSYGFQTPETVHQAIVDAGYQGPTLPYHP